MWNYILIWQAIGWLVIILCSPLILMFSRKVARYLSYAFYPRSTILQYMDDGKITEAYFVQQFLFKRTSFRKLSEEEIQKLGAMK